MVKLEANGNQKWFKQYGGADYDLCWDMVQTTDGGFALAGYTGNKTNGYEDFYLVKTDSMGNMEWENNYGGSQSEIGLSVSQTDDGG